MTHTAEQFLDAILADPSDDAPRLIFADWLDEQVAPTCTSCTGPGRVLDSGNEWKPHPDCKRCRGTGRVPDGRADRAEFIRVQCELARYPRAPTGLGDGFAAAAWKERRDARRRRERELIGKHGHEWAGPALPFRGQFRRGFVAEVTLSAEAFCGGVCRMCDGTGNRHVVRVTKTCPACSGKGRTPGVAKGLFKAAPIEKVTLGDRKPFHYVGIRDSRGWHWGRSSSWATLQDPHWLPPALFDLLPHRVGVKRTTQSANYPAEADALGALNDAACGFGRAAAKEGK